MMYGMSPLRRALYFILPLVFALLLTAIVAIDAANTPDPEATEVTVDVAEGNNWLLFDFNDEDAPERTAGAAVTVVAGGQVLRGELPADRTQILFDLGEGAEVESVEVAWPDGWVQQYGSIPTNARYAITYPATATDAVGQWFEMNGPLYRLGGFAIAGLLLVLLAVRIVFWAQAQPHSHV